MEEDILEKRKEKILNFLKRSQSWVIVLLIIAVILGVYIRSMPMHDHGGKPGLWDITRNDWTLGPDLDPWLFTRTAKIIVEEGSLPEIDTMRFVPVGKSFEKETVLLPYMIVWTYYVVNLFGEYSVEFAATIFPVIMFALTILAFFLFVREIFTQKGKIQSNVIALISTFFMIVIPIFLSRTIAGIPEKESAAFFFMFLAFYFFLRAWKSKTLKESIIFGFLAGSSSAGMGMISGLYGYIYVAIGLAGFLSFILNKFGKKEEVAYLSWWISGAIILSILPGKVNLRSLTTSLTLLPAFMLFVILIFHIILWRTKISENKYLNKIKLPKNIISLIISLSLIFVALLILNPSIILEKIQAIQRILFKPTIGRWNTTVAENRQPYFKEWIGSFGPFIRKIPIFFLLFFIGSVVLFKKMLNKIMKRDAIVLTLAYIFLFSGLVFSRYSSGSLFNGENFISKTFYLVSVLVFFGFFVKYYLRYSKLENRGFERIEFEYLFLIGLLLIMIFSARSAIRLVMMLGPISPIFVGFLIVELFEKWKLSREESLRRLFLISLVIVVLLSFFVFSTFNKSIQSQAYNFVPSSYNQQWQKAMEWVRTETDESAVFAHWWDYGYWVQSIGNRATVTDGGNAITYWNYLSGRYVLTGDNQKDALEFLYNHDADYLLIDSSDIGKYGAFSSIGSDENYDRYSFIPIMRLDSSQIRETATGMQRVYPTRTSLDEDIMFNLNGSEIFLAKGKVALIGIILNIVQSENQTNFNQPIAVFFDGKVQTRIPLRYLEYRGEFFDFGTGLPGAIKVIQSFSQGPQGLNGDEMGGIIYVSPRVLRGYLAQKYIFDDPFEKFPQFEVAHLESNLVVESLRNVGIPAEEFMLYQGSLQGPITIWKINYLGDEKIKEEYQDTDARKYLSWEL